MSDLHVRATRQPSKAAPAPTMALSAALALIALLALGTLAAQPAQAQAAPPTANAALDPGRQGYGMGYVNRRLGPAQAAVSPAASAGEAEPKAAPLSRPIDRQSRAPMSSRGHGGGRRGGR